MLAEKNPYIDSAYQQLQTISMDKEKRLEYETRERAIRDYNQLMLEAEERGEKRGEKHGEKRAIVQTAKNLIVLGVSIETIATATGLPLETIRKLQSEQI